MPLGKEIGTFSAKVTTMRVVAIDGDSSTVELSSEGEVSGQLNGAIIGTTTFTGTNEKGTLEGHGLGLLASGSVGSTSSGVYWLSGEYQWQTRGAINLATGETIIGEGTLDFASRSWSGKIFELE